MNDHPSTSDIIVAGLTFAASRERNDQVIRLGLEWIDSLLTGGAGDSTRAAYEAARAGMLAAGTPAAIDCIAAAFGLSPFEEDVLLIALAADIDGSFAPRYGSAQGRTMASPASAHLIARLLFQSDRLPAEARESFDRRRALRRFALVDIDDSSQLAVAAGIRVPERITNLLCGMDTPDPILSGFAKDGTVVALPDRLNDLATRLVSDNAYSYRLQIVGPAGSGRRAFAASILERLGFGTYCVDANSLSAFELSVLMRECVLGNRGVALSAESSQAAAALNRELSGPLLIVAEHPLEQLEAVPAVHLERIGPEERLSIWQKNAPAADPDALMKLAVQFAVGPTEIHAIAQQHRLPEGDTWSACRNLGARGLAGLTTRVVPEVTLGDLVLHRGTHAELHALVAQVAHRAEVHYRWGYRALLGRATGICALFAGPSGVGKTMAAEAIAHALQLDLFTVDLAQVTSKYIGETEKNLGRIFDAADASGCVLFFDEADSLFGKRSEVKDSHDRYANAEISYLLQRMERFSGLVILATNLKSHLDSAFLRRIRVIIDFPMPDADTRAALWHRALPGSAPQEGIDLVSLAKHELTGGNIMTIASNAAFQAAAEGTAIAMKHLTAAMASEYRKLDRDPSDLGVKR